MSKEAIQLALEALELCNGSQTAEGVVVYTDKEITVLREAIANEALDRMAENARELGLDYEPAQEEPVAWMYVNKSTHETKFQKHMRDFIDHSLWSEVPLYGEPLANHELQCICGAIWLGDEMVHLPDKRLPPQRTWVGLTDKEEVELWESTDSDWELMERIEAKLKEKNNG